MARIDPVLFGWSLRLCRRPRRDGGADLAAARQGANAPPPASPRWSRRWTRRRKAEVPALIGALARRARCDRALGADQAGHRRPARRRLGAARQDRAGRDGGSVDVDEIEEVWHGLAPPYPPLFAWLEGTAPSGPTRRRGAGLPPADAGACRWRRRISQRSTPPTIVAEWKWDGIRVQLVAAAGGERRIYLAHRRRYLRRLPRHPGGDGLRRRARRRVAGACATARSRRSTTCSSG